MAEVPREQLTLVSVKKANRLDDFIGIFPDKVMPTGQIHVLERGGRLLLIKTMSHGRDVAPAQRRLFQLLVGLGEQDTAPGAVTVICVWGLGVALRETVIFDHTGESAKKVQKPDELKMWFRRWWEDRL